MIKHRFIVSETDSRVFAAIPTESKLLTWERWRRPYDWSSLVTLHDEAVALFEVLAERWQDAADGYLAISKSSIPVLDDLPQSDYEVEQRRLYIAHSTETTITSGTCLDKVMDLVRSKISLANATPSMEPALPVKAFIDAISGPSTQAITDMEALVSKTRKQCDYYDSILQGKNTSYYRRYNLLDDHEKRGVLESIKEMYEAHDLLMSLFKDILARHVSLLQLAKKAGESLNFVLPPDLECPVGVPFAAYTIELGSHVVIDVVEGKAWIEGRVATEAERRVAEIVSQMMVERGLNPQAPTRISMREVDPGHAHEQRESEGRPGPPRVRVIKYHVAPPRYLREAAEIILESNRKAHWVVGHWRNQPWGYRNTLRKQVWIAPHIRGLGDAGSTVVKVVATPVQKEGHS